MKISPDFFKNLLNICPDGVLGNDLKGNLLFFNASTEGHGSRRHGPVRRPSAAPPNRDKFQGNPSCVVSETGG